MLKKLILLLVACLLQSCIIIRVYPEQPKAQTAGVSPKGDSFRVGGNPEALPSEEKGAVYFISDSEPPLKEPLQWKTKDSLSENIFVFKPEKEQPLIVVNGQIQDRTYPLQNLKPKDIKEMNVLKGSAAEKKYGEAGANGVIEIILKD
ncbi:MAG: hypothetical protein ACPGC5_00145 [Flavobacteriaceae bacterium]